MTQNDTIGFVIQECSWSQTYADKKIPVKSIFHEFHIFRENRWLTVDLIDRVLIIVYDTEAKVCTVYSKTSLEVYDPTRPIGPLSG